MPTVRRRQVVGGFPIGSLGLTGFVPPIPIERAERQYQVYLRGPSNAVTLAFSVADAYRAGIWHEGRMSVIPSPVDSMEGEFGIIVGGGFTVEIADDMDAVDTFWLWEDGFKMLLEDDVSKYLLEY